VLRPQSGDSHRPEDWLDVLDRDSVPVRCGGGELSPPRIQPLVKRLRDGYRLCWRRSVSVLSHSVTNAASAIPASFFVPWKVLFVYRFRPLPSVPTKAWSRQDDGPRCCMCPGMTAPSNPPHRRSESDCRHGLPVLQLWRPAYPEIASDKVRWFIGFWRGLLAHRTTIEPSTRQLGLPA
jgi:hypothetical protein